MSANRENNDLLLKSKLFGVDRLMALPDVFSFNTLIKVLNCSHKEAKNFLFYAKKRKYIEDLGPRAKIYFNILKNKNAKDENIYKAYTAVYPDMILGGIARLREADWMTQISQQEELIVLKRNKYIKLYNVELMPRSKYWYKKYMDGVEKDGILKKLKPEYAFVDLCENGSYVPDPDDLYIEDENDIKKIYDVFNIMKVEIPEKLEPMFSDFLIKKDIKIKNKY